MKTNMILGYSNFILIVSVVIVVQGTLHKNELKHREDSNKSVDTIETIVVKELDKLPDVFDMSMLPQSTQATSTSKGESVQFDHLGTIDKLLKRNPDDPFTTDTKFHLFNGGERRTIPFKLFKTCLNGIDEVDLNPSCNLYPINLEKMLNIFDMNKRTLIIVGGFLMNAPADWQLQIADKWLRLEDLNVIIVSWNKGNKFMYPKAVSNTKVVARQVVILLYYLAKLHNLDPRDRKFTDNIMIVGHSLGAHIAGFIGQDFGGKIGRITGLDPAGPAFSVSSESHRLDRNDALLVDVIHTNADFGFRFFLGLYTPVGHVDYYANDGKWQPNCHMANFFECNHSAVINYYLAILDHELIIRDHFDTNLREKYRIIAYMAQSYEQFRSGRSMHKHCPNMANDGYDTFYQAGLVDFHRCTMPIDVIKKARDFRQELQEKYHINFEPNHISQVKYYFFTSAQHPYVVDHNLIKIQYEIPNGIDRKITECEMKITYKMLDDDFEDDNHNDNDSKRNADKNQSRLPRIRPIVGNLQNYDDHPQSTIPFVVANRIGRYMLIDVDNANFYLPSKETLKIRSLFEEFERKILKHVYKIFPLQIDIAMAKYIAPREYLSDGHVGHWAISKAARKMRIPMSSIISSKICPYKLKTVRIQPLRMTNRLIMAVYTTHRAVTDNDGFKPKIIVLDENQQIPEINIDLSGKGIANPTVYLSSIIIGPNYGSSIKSSDNNNNNNNNNNAIESSLAQETPYTQYLNLDPKVNLPLDKLNIEREFMTEKLVLNRKLIDTLDDKQFDPDKLVYFDMEQNKLIDVDDPMAGKQARANQNQNQQQQQQQQQQQILPKHKSYRQYMESNGLKDIVD